MSNKNKRNRDLAQRFRDSGNEYYAPQLQKVSDDNDAIVFSFQFLQNEYGLDRKSLTKDNKIQLLKKLVAVSKTTWNALVLKPKSSGFELLDKSAVSPLPPVVTDDIQKLYVLRFASQDCRLVGFRQDNVYHILYIDSDLSLYNH